MAVLFKSLSRTVTCTRELISMYLCYSRGDGLNTSLSRLSSIVLYTLVNLEYRRFCKAEGMFKSLTRTVTCTRKLISMYMCYSQGDGLNTPLSRLSYLVLYTVLQFSTLSSCTLCLYVTKYPMYWTLIMNVI